MFLSISKKRWATILIIIGVCAWIPYMVLKYGMGEDIIVYPFLAVHLSGGDPGVPAAALGIDPSAGAAAECAVI